MLSENFCISSKVRFSVFAAPLSFVLAGCVSDGPTPDQMSRTAVETAPADLQLVCANEAARALSTNPSKTLPVSSRRIDANTYEVRLNAEGKYASCNVMHNGSVISVNAE